METTVVGKTSKFITPSKFEVTIREQTGDDDEIISRIKNASDGSSVNKFASSIILETSLDIKKPTPNDILKWKNKDKYYVLFKSRLLSLGTTITYKHTCSNSDCKKDNDFEEDLLQYDRDFSKDDTTSANGFKYQVTPYPNGAELQHEFAISSGKKFRYTYLNGLSEKELLGMNKDNISKNTELTVRKLEWFDQDKWITLSSFKSFSSKEMVEIRESIKKNDEPFDAITEAECPYCKTVDRISLMVQADFFFPGETL